MSRGNRGLQRNWDPPAPPAAPATNDRRQIAGTSAYDAPLIAHTAELAIATKEFARSRTELEEILERHRGYAARLRMVGRRTGSVLTATLRIPSPELISMV